MNIALVYIYAMKKIIDRIIVFRKEKGFTQKEMAEKLGVSVVSYNKIERGETQLSIEKVYNIATVLNIDPATLLYPNFDQVKYNENLKKEVARLSKENSLLNKTVDVQQNLISLIYDFNPDIKTLVDVHKHLLFSDSKEK